MAELRAIGEPGDLGWIVMANAEVYAAEFGWDASYESLVARIVTDFATSASSRRAGWIAVQGNKRVGCVLMVEEDVQTARLRLLLVHPDGRGEGTGGALVDAALQFARGAGFGRVVLWTNHPLTIAGAIYRNRGFALTAEEPHHSFGVDLLGQTYELDLRATPGAPVSVPGA